MSLKTLIDVLCRKSDNFNVNMKKLIEDIENIEFSEFRKYIKFNQNKYNKTILYRDELFEIILISWLPHQHTKLHLHPKNGCIMKILYGNLNEIKVLKGENIESNYQKDDITFMHDIYGKHIISNINNKPAISLHIYSPPNFYQ